MLSIGKVCSFPGCGENDFLPSKCGTCGKTFCHNHALAQRHQCVRHDAVVPHCPLCGAVVPLYSPDEPVDQAVDAHIRRGCAPPRKDPALTFPCELDGCTKREPTKSLLTRCEGCGRQHCLEHRHPSDHRCGMSTVPPRRQTPPPQPVQQQPAPPQATPAPAAPLQRLHVSCSNTAHNPLIPPNQALGDCIVVQVYFPLQHKGRVLESVQGVWRTEPPPRQRLYAASPRRPRSTRERAQH